MGIVSFCPNGHRVKVKDHLAGKKGICPSCGERFRIPHANGTPAVTSQNHAPSGLPIADVTEEMATLGLEGFPALIEQGARARAIALPASAGI